MTIKEIIENIGVKVDKQELREMFNEEIKDFKDDKTKKEFTGIPIYILADGLGINDYLAEISLKILKQKNPDMMYNKEFVITDNGDTMNLVNNHNIQIEYIVEYIEIILELVNVLYSKYIIEMDNILKEEYELNVFNKSGEDISL